jgi:hypothetical protein
VGRATRHTAPRKQSPPPTPFRFGRRDKRTTMPNVTVIGAQWGDEGKGKIVDWLSSRADVSCASRADTTPVTRW